VIVKVINRQYKGVPTAVFQIVLPVYTFVAMSMMAVRRLAVRKQTGVDPLAWHPLRHATEATRYVERALALGTIALNVDTVANALRPVAVSESLAVPLLRESEMFGWIGLAMLTGGFALDLVALFAMGASWRVGIDREHPGPLVTTGIYSLLRHPIYTGVMLMACGQALVTADVISIPVAAAAVVGLPIQAHLEEEFLTTRFGASYKEYCERTRRF
jgi:protein-S-isoprenylcysteine O-methyltransferase Ste14